jgi:hypothetical protein
MTRQQDDDETFRWPVNLYVETRDMAAASFLVYTFGYLLDASRRHSIAGLSVDQMTGRMAKSIASAFNPDTSALGRSFTPAEVKSIVEDNPRVLAQDFPDEFGKPERILESLKVLQDRVDASASSAENSVERPLTLMEYDDRHQDRSLVYGVAKDDVNKRITLVFRGTDNDLSFHTNWAANTNIAKTSVPVPSKIQSAQEGAADHILFGWGNTAKNAPVYNVFLHAGFYSYLFDKLGENHPSKYEEILQDLVPLLKAHPTYKLYVTGHSLVSETIKPASLSFH